VNQTVSHLVVSALRRSAVRTRDTQSLEYLLERIHAIEGFKGTRSYIALSTYLERGPNPQIA
jgi:hypothetical protein